MDYPVGLPEQIPELVLVSGHEDFSAGVVSLDSSESDSDNDEHRPSNGGTERRTLSKGGTVDTLFIDLLATIAPELLEKSQTPYMKQKKAIAMEKLQRELLVRYGQSLSDKQISKKIYNLKTRVKLKMHLCQSGDKKMNLNPTEIRFYELMVNPIPEEAASGHVDMNDVGNLPVTVEPTAIEESSSDESSVQKAEPDAEPIHIPKIRHEQPQKSNLKRLQETILQEQLNLIRTRDMLLRQQHDATMRQQQEKHDEEIKLLKRKQEIAEYQLEAMKADAFVRVKTENQL